MAKKRLASNPLTRDGDAGWIGEMVHQEQEDTPRSRKKEPAPTSVDLVQLNARVPREAKKQLALLVAEQDKKQEALMVEALNLLFKKYGKNSLAKPI